MKIPDKIAVYSMLFNAIYRKQFILYAIKYLFNLFIFFEEFVRV